MRRTGAVIGWLAACGHAMPPMGVDQPVLGHVPQPEMKRHGRMDQILLQAAISLDEHILHDIAGIHPALDRRIESQVYQPPQCIAVAIEQFVDRRAIAGFRALEQLLGLRRVGPHSEGMTNA